MAATEPNLARKAIRGALWSLGTRYSAKITTLLSVVILARLLDKEAFGVAGYALLVLGILETVRDLGVGQALIYHREDPEAPSTAFWTGMAMGFLLFAVTWLAAPLLGDFFNDPRAVPVTRALAFVLPLSTLRSVHAALMRRDLKFKRKFVPDIIRVLVKGVVAISLALLGYGAWSLVFGQIAAVVAAVVAFWTVYNWRPSFVFSRRLLRPLLGYGSNIVGLNLLSAFVRNLDQFIIGRILGAGALGVYTVALRLPQLLILQVCAGVSQVLFPVYTRMKDDVEKLGRGFVRTTRYMALITVPLGVGLALVAEPLVLTLFGAKWSEAVPVLRALSLQFVLSSFSYNAGDVYKAQGRPGLLVRLALLRMTVLLPALWWAATGPGTIVAVVWTRACVALAFGSLDLAVAAHLLKAPFTKVVAAPLPALAGGAGMSAVVLAVLTASKAAPAPVQLALGVVAGVLSYAGTLRWLAPDVVATAGESLRDALGRR